MEESEELKSLLMKVKEERGKVGLKLNIQKTKIMASSPITSRQINGETVETVADFIFLGSKITADGDCSHEIKRPNQFILKEISPEYSLEGLMLKLKLQILLPPDVKNWLTGKDPDTGKDWRQEKKGMIEDDMVGWHHQLDRRE